MGTRYPVSGAVAAASSLVFKVEVPTGLINGSNTTFTASVTPRTPQINNLAVFQNGSLLRPTTDYTVSGVTITFAAAPLTGDSVLITYVALV